MKGHQHGHNLRSAPHIKRTVRANSRIGSNNRTGRNLPPRSAPESRKLQQHRGSETLGTGMQSKGGYAGDAPATTNSMQVIAAQQQQMQQMQRMMLTMQQ